MARSKSFFDDVKNHLECSVCQEQFSEINEPKILKCLHTFCKTCLEAWLRQQREGELSCPTCRQITECPNNIQSLPSNLFCKQLVEIVEAYSGKGQEDSPHCGICDEKKPLKFYCSDCNSFLCDDCVRAHKKGKVFKGHHVKEIGNFESSDVQDYARRANFCKKHKDEMRFFCEKCQICICLNCAILEHQDHNKISLDQRLENNKSEIEIKVREVQENSARLRNYKDSLEKRRLQVNGSIEEATKEVKRVAERCMLFIRQHEASVTERLVVQKAALQDAFDTQMTSLDSKLMEIENTLAFSEEILLRKNLPEILNVKATIEQRLQELSVPFKATSKLGCSRVKYVQSDVSFLKDAPGKLITTDTEASLSVTEGKNLTEGLVGEDCSFTVITKHSAGQTTCSEIDEVSVEITSLSQDNIKTVVTDLKDGRYSISYRPTSPGEFTVSIKVEGNEIMGSPFKLKVSTRSQCSKEEKITPLKSTRSRISCDNSGASMEQVPKTTTVSASCQERKDYVSPLHEEEQEEVSQNTPATAAENEVVHLPERINDKKNTDRKVSSVFFGIQSFEIERNIVRVFVKAHDKELEEIETNYHVEIPRQAEGNKLCLKPKDECSADDYEEACNKFISLYQKMYQLIKMQRFSLKSDRQRVTARAVISHISKKIPISVERIKDNSFEIYGEASHIEEALKYLKEEGVEINMEKEDTMDVRGRRKQWKDNVDPHKHFIGDNNPGNRLETFLGIEGGGSKVPTSRSNRGRRKTRNKPHTANPNGTGVNQYDGSFFGSSAVYNDHPLSPVSHPAPSNSSYRNAVKGYTVGRDPRPPIDQRGVTTDKELEDTCPICLDPISSPRSLNCQHVFCSGCLQTALDVCNKCPVCQAPQGVLKGNQPRGEMRSRTEGYSVPGYEGYGTIIIDYNFLNGVQGPEHPNPGQYYYGISHTAYLPDTREGREVLQLLRKAFDARLVFTVGTSFTTGRSNQVIWNDIHHKTSVHGGFYGSGYPDPDYLRRVKEELAAKGIR